MSAAAILCAAGGCLCLVALSGCKEPVLERSAPQRIAARTQLNEHGIQVGDRLASLKVSCSDAHDRIVGVGRQIVTLTTMEDLCSECHRHLRGLSEIWRSGTLGAEQMLVTYATPARRVEAIRTYRDVPNGALCFDEAGVIWAQYRVTHTPVTLLLVDGRVTFIHDAPLDDEPARAAFMKAVVYTPAR